MIAAVCALATLALAGALALLARGEIIDGAVLAAAHRLPVPLVLEHDAAPA